MAKRKVVSQAQLTARKKQGAKATKQASEVIVQRFDELLAKLDAFEKLNERRTEAQVNLMETMQELIAAGREAQVDITPMTEVLERIEALSAAKAPATYEFTFKHKSDGRYAGITATPKVTKH